MNDAYIKNAVISAYKGEIVYIVSYSQQTRKEAFDKLSEFIISEPIVYERSSIHKATNTINIGSGKIVILGADPTRLIGTKIDTYYCDDWSLIAEIKARNINAKELGCDDSRCWIVCGCDPCYKYDYCKEISHEDIRGLN